MYQEANIHQKTAHAKKRGTNMKTKKHIKWGHPRANSHDKKVTKAQIE